MSTSSTLMTPSDAAVVAAAAEAPETRAAGPHAIDPQTTIIKPPRGWQLVNVRELWRYRELLYFLTWRDVKVRYKQTLLGAAWAILQPLFTMIIFTLLFGRLAGIKSDDIPYPMFAYAGLLPWTFFSNAMTASGNSL